MPITLSESKQISVGAARVVAIDCTNALSLNPATKALREFLTGTPMVVEVTTTDLTITNKTVSTQAEWIKGRSVVTGAAILFRVAGQKVGVTYRVRVTCSTNGTPAQTLVYDVLLVCV
jgi:hypothetical protein